MKKFFVAIMVVAILVSAVAFTACTPTRFREYYTIVAPDGYSRFTV